MTYRNYLAEPVQTGIHLRILLLGTPAKSIIRMRKFNFDDNYFPKFEYCGC